MAIKSFGIKETASKLNITEIEVHTLISDGQLSAIRIGNEYKILEYALEDYQSRKLSIKTEGVADSTDIKTSAPYIICGQDPVIDYVWEQLSGKGYERPLSRSYMCSYQSLNALYFGEVDAACAHLLEASTNTYNANYVKYLVPGFDCALIHLTRRSQGFFVKQGNPKNIHDWDDLKREDVTFMNREIGAGVRVLIDERLREHGISPAQVNGYDNIAHSHMAAATAVGRGECDVSLGAKRVASQVKGIEFMEMQRECYELVVRKEKLEDPQIKDIISILQSPETKDYISRIQGYYPEETGKVTIIENGVIKACHS